MSIHAPMPMSHIQSVRAPSAMRTTEPLVRPTIRDRIPRSRSGSMSAQPSRWCVGSGPVRPARLAVASCARTLHGPSGRDRGGHIRPLPPAPGCSPYGEHHGQAAAGGVVGVQSAADGLCEAAGDREAESHPVAARSVAVALEGFEDAVLDLVRDTGAAVDDPDLYPVGYGARGDQDALARRVVLHRVLDDVG